MPWIKHDPIDYLLSRLAEIRPVRIALQSVLFGSLALWAFAAATTPLDHADALRELREPLRRINEVTGTTQTWGMFYADPTHRDLKVTIYTGTKEIGTGRLEVENVFGPILPSLTSFRSESDLRPYLLFRRMLASDKASELREKYVSSVSTSLLKLQSGGQSTASTHFLILVEIKKNEESWRGDQNHGQIQDQIGPMFIGWTRK